MLNNKIKIWFLLCFGFTLFGCKDFLDVVPREFHQEQDLLSDIKQAEKQIAILYSRLPSYFHAGANNNMLSASASDEAYANWDQSQARLYEQGAWNPLNNPFGNYESSYESIRIAYRFLETIDEVPVLDSRIREQYENVVIPRYKNEVKVILAYTYFELLRRYGAIPIVDRVYSVEDMDELLLKDRRPVDEVCEFIVTLCEEAATGLPLAYDDEGDFGRATKGAALALKAKTLLYSASPLFNGGELDGQAITIDGQAVRNTILGVTNSDGTALFNQHYDREKWKRAAEAAKEVIDLGIYDLAPVQRDLFYKRDRIETVWHKQGGGYTASQWDRQLMPNGTDIGGSGALSVTNAMVDSYEMDNGLPIDDVNSGYTPDVWVDTIMNVYRDRAWKTTTTRIRGMYHNRDPRFYTDIYFHGMPLLHRNVITEFVSNVGSNNDGWGNKTGQNTRTGYYVQKWVDPTQNIRDRPNTNRRNFALFRLADVYLWYAEALNEYYDSPTSEVYEYVNRVRNRVGMPSLPIQGRQKDLTKEGMRQRIRNERKIELSMEGHRFFDIRRWLIAHTEECTSLMGMNINASGDAFYKPTPVRNGRRVFDIHHYLMPLPTTEITKAPGALIQNYGWEANSEG